MTDDKYYYYLQDLGLLIKRYALEAAKELREKKEVDDNFHQGVLAAYYRVITLMQQQAEGFDINLSAIGLDDIDPDRDLG